MICRAYFFYHYPSNLKLSKHHQALFTYARTHDSNCCSLSIIYCLYKITLLCLQIINSMTAALRTFPTIHCQVHSHSFPVFPFVSANYLNPLILIFMLKHLYSIDHDARMHLDTSTRFIILFFSSIITFSGLL